MIVKESRNLEFKEQVTKTFLKTVSAYANYGAGEIRFGIKDDGQPVGFADPVQVCLDIENKINDSISPRPRYQLEIIEHKMISLKVEEGQDKPYLYKGKAYTRNDTSSVEVSREELSRLTLQGRGQNFDELPTAKKSLTFGVLEAELQKKAKIDNLNGDILKTLNLYKDGEFNNAASLLADENGFPGIDIVRFGQSLDEIMERKQLAGQSILLQLQKAVAVFSQYYQYEKIVGTSRTKEDLIPLVAFREALANALVHRAWDVRGNILIGMYPDRIEINSPGVLPFGISEAEYLEGMLSIPRNPILASVFYRLDYIEMFGTGIKRIKAAYSSYGISPQFEVLPNAVQVILPAKVKLAELSGDEQIVLAKFQAFTSLTSSELVELTGFSRAKINRLLAKMVAKKILKRIGKGRATSYQR
ncbi:MAG: ATP-binding protein [Ligilactobacillus agilis]|nr:putative DNA binding domain-containing protein [Ligilactobacillus agilis]MDY4065254.1 ATP-binding protein [Ligilactobacillus agilis]